MKEERMEGLINILKESNKRVRMNYRLKNRKEKRVFNCRNTLYTKHNLLGKLQRKQCIRRVV